MSVDYRLWACFLLITHPQWPTHLTENKEQQNFLLILLWKGISHAGVREVWGQTLSGMQRGWTSWTAQLPTPERVELFLQNPPGSPAQYLRWFLRAPVTAYPHR